MKYKFLLPGLVLILLSFELASQTTSFSTDFSNPTGANGTWAMIDEGYNEFTKTISNGEMKISYNKTSWHFIQLWIRPFNIVSFPYLKFTAKADAAGNLSVRIKDQNGNQVEKAITLTTEYQVFFFNLTADLSTFTTTLDEIQFDVGYGAYSGSLYLNDFMLGEAASPQVKPPTIDKVDNLLVFKGSGMQSMKLTGITNGGEEGQAITVEAEATDTSLVRNLVVQYASPDDTAILQFMPSLEKLGTSKVTVTVTDEGEVENVVHAEFNVIIAEYGSTGFTDDFGNMEMDTLWDQSNPDYSLDRSGGILHVNVHKNSGYETFSCKLPGIYDFSVIRYMNVDVKGDEPIVLMVQLVDMNGMASSREIRVLESSAFVTATFDFGSETRVDLVHINEVRFAINPQALTFNANVILDDLKIGSDAVPLAYLASPGDKIYYKDAGNVDILLTDISNSSAISVIGASGLTGNAIVSAVSDGMAELSFDILPGVTGRDTVMLTATGEGEFEDNTVCFVITVTENLPPTIDAPENIITSVGQEEVIKLTDLSDGDIAAEQELTITAASSNPAVVTGPLNVSYQQGSPYGYLALNPVDTGRADITIRLKDNSGGLDSASVTFEIRIYGSLNHPPTIDPVEKIAVFNEAVEQSVMLTGISDGDDGSQDLTFKATSSDESIVSNPLVVEYDGVSDAVLKFTPDPDHTGITDITLTITDNGGSPENNGNDSTVIIFQVETRVTPKTGYVVPFTGNASDLLAGEEQLFQVSYVDSTGFRAMKIEMTDKWDYGGLWMNLPYELDLTEYPYISYDVYSVNDVTYHWNYFFDVDMDRNIQNSSAHMLPAAANKWVTISFDYSDDGDMNNEAGELIQAGRVTDVLFNLHNRPGSWPFTDYSGTVYYRNIRIGDKAVIPSKTPVATIDGIPEQVHFMSEGVVSLKLTGISDGAGSTTGVTVTAVSTLPNIISDPLVGALQPDGTVDVTYIVGASYGIIPVDVRVECEGSTSKTIRFDINVLKKDITTTATLSLDRSITYQTMLGFGTYQNEPRWVELYATDLGASAVRAGLIGNQIEPVNDNDDPFVLNREALNYSAFDWQYFRDLKAAGVETFILTSWSSPAWMKNNLSLDWYIPQALGSTTECSNHLEYYYYEEFAESMVAVVRMFEEEAGIHLEAIGLQNEPAFNEPYPSAILDPTDFPKLIKVVGERFEAEGIGTRLFMPEQVFGQYLSSMNNYIDALVDDPEADQYCDIIAVHGYANDGITPGFPNYDGWKDLWTRSQTGSDPKELWMSETFIEGGTFDNALDLAGAIHGSLVAGNVSLWTNWSFGDMQLSRNEPTSSFYTSKNYYKFIRPGAIRIKSISDNADVMISAFEHPGNQTMTLVVINKSLQARSAKLFGNNLPAGFKIYRTTEHEKFLEVDSVFSTDISILPPRSVTTFLSNDFRLLKINAVADQYIYKNDPEQTINLSGIDDGSGGTAGLVLSVESEDPSLLTGLIVSAVETNGTAVLNYTPKLDYYGDTKVTVTVSDGIHETKMSFYVIVRENTGVMEIESLPLRVYPNPTRGVLHIEIPDPSFTQLSVNDLTGRIILQKVVASQNLVTIETAGYESGTYILILSNDKEKLRAKFVVE